jgi:transposase-like protein
LAGAIIELLPPLALRDTTQYANNRVESDHGRLKARLRPMRCLKRAFVQNLRRGHYELEVDARPVMILAAACRLR